VDWDWFGVLHNSLGRGGSSRSLGGLLLWLGERDLATAFFCATGEGAAAFGAFGSGSGASGSGVEGSDRVCGFLRGGGGAGGWSGDGVLRGRSGCGGGISRLGSSTRGAATEERHAESAETGAVGRLVADLTEFLSSAGSAAVPVQAQKTASEAAGEEEKG